MSGTSAYQPLMSARRPGGKPAQAPTYRILVHRRFLQHYAQMAERVGLQQAQQFWDHVAHEPGKPDPIAQTCFLRGKAGRPQSSGWSRTIHYELSSSARIDYQYCDDFQTCADGDAHPVVAILTINYGSH
ncbi:hypothetical protein [Nonomuraea sp. NPDC046570]|uniref:hypothetical protein n=1 Tax=Nonomuraea sp. NPDC046570 TaxID=3155255 RepID=UPI0033F1EEAE